MTAVERIQGAQEARLVDERGKPVRLELLPALGVDAIDALEKRVGQRLPKELREVLSFCGGIDGCLNGIDFTGTSMMYGQEELFPNGLPIAGDGFGNCWLLDITPHTTVTAPVYFACHDAPVILYQCADLESFLAEAFRMLTPPHKSLIREVGEDRVFDVWRKNPGVLDQATAAASSDAELRAFAGGLPGHFQIVDLRTASPGMGFSWGRYGARTELRRHGYERIFGYAKPASTGFFARLLGR